MPRARAAASGTADWSLCVCSMIVAGGAAGHRQDVARRFSDAVLGDHRGGLFDDVRRDGLAAAVAARTAARTSGSGTIQGGTSTPGANCAQNLIMPSAPLRGSTSNSMTSGKCSGPAPYKQLD
jgi:hypothetical protein